LGTLSTTRYQRICTLSTKEMIAARRTSAPERRTFRHGNLRRVLLDAGIELARKGGPSAVALREAALLHSSGVRSKRWKICAGRTALSKLISPSTTQWTRAARHAIAIPIPLDANHLIFASIRATSCSASEKCTEPIVDATSPSTRPAETGNSRCGAAPGRLVGYLQVGCFSVQLLSLKPRNFGRLACNWIGRWPGHSRRF
jgi:hypothetical protein